MKTLGQVDRRLRQAFPHCALEVFGGCSCLLFGDFGQLPPVMDLPLYTTDSRSELSDQGRAAYQNFKQAVVLDQVMRQSGQDPQQVLFRDILQRLRDAKVTVPDWNCLMAQTPTHVQDLSPFCTALHLIPTVEAVVEHNVAQLRASGQPIATIKAVHTGANVSKAPADDAGGLEAVICLAKLARVMLTSNLWVKSAAYVKDKKKMSVYNHLHSQPVHNHHLQWIHLHSPYYFHPCPAISSSSVHRQSSLHSQSS